MLNLNLNLFYSSEYSFSIYQNKIIETILTPKSNLFIYKNQKLIKNYLYLDVNTIQNKFFNDKKYNQKNYLNKKYISKNKILIKTLENQISINPEFNIFLESYKDTYSVSPFLYDLILKEYKLNKKLTIEILPIKTICEECGSLISKIVNFYFDEKLIFSTKHNYLDCENSIPLLTGSILSDFYNNILNGEVNFDTLNILLFEFIKQFSLIKNDFKIEIKESFYDEKSLKTKKYIEDVLEFLSFNLTKIIFYGNSFFKNFFFKNLINQIKDTDNNYNNSNFNRKSDLNECCVKFGKDKSLLTAQELLNNALKNGKVFRTFADKTYIGEIIDDRFILTDFNDNKLVNFDIRLLTSQKKLELLEKIRNSIEKLFWN